MSQFTNIGLTGKKAHGREKERESLSFERNLPIFQGKNQKTGLCHVQDMTMRTIHELVLEHTHMHIRGTY